MLQNPTLFEISADVNEDGSFTLKGCLESEDGTGALQTSGMKLVKQADLASITLTVFRKDTPATITIPEAALTIASVLFDTLQTTWARDARGYNFRYTVPAAACPTGNRKYTARVKATTSGGVVSFMRFHLQALPTS